MASSNESGDDRDLLRKADELLERLETPPDDILPAGGAFAHRLGEDLADELAPAGDVKLAGGTRVGRFVVLERAGAGGMGVVYAAYDPQLDRRVALKLLRPRRRTTDASSRLLREARALAALAHPNVLPVYDVVDTGEQLVMATEFVDGPSLRDWQSDRSPAEILEVYLQAARGLAAAHDADLVHRDFKPENVLIGDDSRARVTDFGLALASTSGHGATSQAAAAHPGWGTRGYTAPEAARGQAADARSDQYAFCVALVEALTGELPGAEDLPGELEDLDRLEPWLRDILRRGCADQPTARFESMAELIDALEAGPAVVTPLWRRYLPVSLLVIALLTLWGVRQWQQPATPAGNEQVRVIVGPFVNASGDPNLEWVEEGLRRIVAETLDGVADIEAIDWSRLQRDHLVPASSEALTDELSQRLLTALQAEVVLSADFAASDSGLEVRYTSRSLGGSAEVGTIPAADAVAGGEALVNRWVTPSASKPPSLADRFSANPLVTQLLAVGLDRKQRSGYAEALAIFEAAAELDPSVGWTRLQITECLYRLGRTEEADGAAEELLRLADEAGDQRLEATARVIQGTESLADFATRRQTLRRAAELFTETGHQEDQAWALRSIGRSYQEEAEILQDASDPGAAELTRQAIVAYRQAIAILEQRTDPASQIHRGYLAGLVEIYEGRAATAEAELQVTVDLAEQHGYSLQQALALNTLHRAIHQQGRPEEARQALLASIEKHREIENWWGLSTVQGNLAEREAEAKNWGAAHQAWTEALASARLFGSGELIPPVARARKGLGEALLATRDPGAALPHLVAARAFYGDTPELLELEASAQMQLASSSSRQASPVPTP